MNWHRFIFGGVPDRATMRRMTRVRRDFGFRYYERFAVGICNIMRNFGLTLAEASDSLRVYRHSVKPYQAFYRCKWNILTGLVIK